jgi:hypothetical protein
MELAPSRRKKTASPERPRCLILFIKPDFARAGKLFVHFLFQQSGPTYLVWVASPYPPHPFGARAGHEEVQEKEVIRTSP